MAPKWPTLAWFNWMDERALHVAAIAAATFVAVALLRRVLRPAVHRAVLRDSATRSEMELRRRAETLSSVLSRSAEFVLLLIAALMALDALGFTVAPVLTGLGISGIAFGLGAQGLVRDLIAGIFILVENQFGHGDLVTVGGVQGYVEDINLRRTLIRDLDGALWTVPNGSITVSGNQTRVFSGVSVAIPVAASADIDQAWSVIERACRDLAGQPDLEDLVVELPRPVRVEALSAGSVTVRILGKAAPGGHLQVAGAVRRACRAALAAAGIALGDPPPAPAAAPGAPPAVRPLV